MTELYREALRAGANAHTRVLIEEVEFIDVHEGSDEQLVFVSEIERFEIENLDALITIWADRYTRAFSQADPVRVSRRIASRRALTNRYWERMDEGKARWVGTRFPTHAHAQDADRSLTEYEDFVYGACHVRESEDPVAYWQGVSVELNARARELETFRELRIVGPDTDLRVNVEGRGWLAADGKLNMPDGEIFTSPVETETSGDVRFSFPAIFRGRGVEDVRLRFESGRVVHAEAAEGDDYLQSLLDMDEGSRILGEVAFGMNYEVDRFTRDMIFDLRADGEIYADGELVWKAGRFLHEPLAVANEPVAAS